MHDEYKKNGMIVILIGLLALSLVFNLMPQEPQIVQSTIVQCTPAYYDTVSIHVVVMGQSPEAVEHMLLHEYAHFLYSGPNTEAYAIAYERTHEITEMINNE